MKIRVWLFFIALLFSSLTKGQEAKLMLPIGHTSNVYSFTFSSDDQRLLTAGDNTVKLWDVKTGVLLLNLTGHTGAVLGASFYPDKSRIFSYATDKTAKIWDATTGRLIATLNHNAKVLSGTISADGTKIITSSDDRAVRIWDSNTGLLITTLKGHTSGVSSAMFSKDGRIALTAGDLTAKLWDTTTGLPILNLAGHRAQVYTAIFSKDEAKILTASADTTAKVWDAKTGKLLLTLKGHQDYVRTAIFSPDEKRIITSSWDQTLKVWDSSTGKLLWNVNNVYGKLLSYAVSPDGNKLVTTTRLLDKLINIWDLKTGTIVNEFDAGLYPAGFNLSHDGKLLAYCNYDGNIKLMEIETGRILTDLSGHTKSILTSEYAPNNNYLLYNYSLENNYKVMDPKNGKLIYTLYSIFTPAFSPDGENIMAVSRKNLAIKISSARNGELIKEIPNLTRDTITNVIYSPVTSAYPRGAKMIAAFGSNSNVIKIIDTKDYTVVSTIKCRASKLLFSPDGKKIFTTTIKGENKIWDLNNGMQSKLLKSSEDGYLSNVLFSANSKMLAYNFKNLVSIWDTDTGLLLFELKVEYISNLVFSPDNKLLVIKTYEGLQTIDVKTGKTLLKLPGLYLSKPMFPGEGTSNISANTILVGNDHIGELIKIETGETVAKFIGHSGYIKIASFSQDKKYILTVASDNTMKFWSIDTKELLYTYIPIDDTDYLVVDKYNRYDGTEAARKLLYFTCGTEVIRLDQVKDQLWVPNLAQRIMNGETINAPKLEDLQICGLTPEVEKVQQQDPDFHYLIKPRRGGLGETVLLVNDIEVKRYKPEQLQKSGANYMLHIPKAEIQTFFMPGKPNQITVRSYTAKNDISSRGAVATNKASGNNAPPNLYAIFVGVSDYKGAELDLKYAAKDAKDLSTALSASARKLLNIDGKEHVFTYHLTTKQGDVFPEKAAIRNVFEEIGKKATANDIFMVFFAGHGVMQGEKKQFYFLTADASINSATTAAGIVGIGTDELSSWMKP